MSISMEGLKAAVNGAHKSNAVDLSYVRILMSFAKLALDSEWPERARLPHPKETFEKQDPDKLTMETMRNAQRIMENSDFQQEVRGYNQALDDCLPLYTLVKAELVESNQKLGNLMVDYARMEKEVAQLKQVISDVTIEGLEPLHGDGDVVGEGKDIEDYYKNGELEYNLASQSYLESVGWYREEKL